MKDCKACGSLHEETGDICKVCIVNNVKYHPLAYRNMAKRKSVHPCPRCQRLTPNENGSFCVKCKEYYHPKKGE